MNYILLFVLIVAAGLVVNLISKICSIICAYIVIRRYKKHMLSIVEKLQNEARQNNSLIH